MNFEFCYWLLLKIPQKKVATKLGGLKSYLKFDWIYIKIARNCQGKKLKKRKLNIFKIAKKNF